MRPQTAFQSILIFSFFTVSISYSRVIRPYKIREVTGSEVKSIEEETDDFFHTLKSFVKSGKFDYEDFLRQSKEARRRISEIEYRAKTSSASVIWQVEEKVEEARMIYQTMLDVADQIVLFKRGKLPGYELVVDMMEQRVLALAMYDRVGYINYRNCSVVAKVRNLSLIPQEMESRFEKMNDKTSISRTFVEQWRRMTAVFEALFDAAKVE